mmetsp:Transcript_36678/g.86091  ORF Transcript_36678/g.86091 Transcript_36678/m.86091 type:complete len:354 (+) Transcript_36678:230-1291(+)
MQVKRIEDGRVQLHVGPHHLDRISPVLLRQLPGGLLYGRICTGLEPQEAKLAVCWPAIARLNPVARELFKGGLRSSLLSKRDGLHEPEVQGLLLQSQTELLSHLANLIERVDPHNLRYPDVVLALQGCLEHSRSVTARHGGEGGSPVEFSAQSLPHRGRAHLVSEQQNVWSLDIVKPLAQLVLVLEDRGVVGHHGTGPLAQILGRGRALTEDLRRSPLVLSEPAEGGVLVDGGLAAHVRLLPAIDGTDVQEVLEGVCELDVLASHLPRLVVIRLVELNKPGLDAVIDLRAIQVGCELGDVGVAVNVLLGSRLTFFHEHHLASSADDPHVPVGLATEELAKHGFRLFVRLVPLL